MESNIMEEYPYTEVRDGKEYNYIDLGTYYVTNLETGDKRLVQRQAPFFLNDCDDLIGEPDDEGIELTKPIYDNFQVVNEANIVRTDEEIRELYNCEGEFGSTDEVLDMSF